MIIKSMSGKKPDFRRLVEYIGRDGIGNSDYVLMRNLYAEPVETDNIIQQFEANSSYLPKRKNGNFLYHEIISLESNPHISEKEQARVLIDLINRYVEQRAPRQMAYGCMHQDSDNLHFHILLSANTVRSHKRVRVTRADFVEIEQNLEAYKIETYPKLDQTRLHTKNRDTPKKSNKEFALKERTGKMSKKDRVQEVLSSVFASVKSTDSLHSELKSVDLELYKRGKHWGVRDTKTGSKLRLKTIGMDITFEEMQKRISLLQDRQAEVAWIRSNQNEQERER